jgi:WD40 repeat protein
MAGHSDEHPPGNDRARLDSTGEFFSVGAPLHAVRAGYVRRSADDVLYTTVKAGRFAHVIAPDRSGKSSLIAAAAARLENNGFKVATLDLEQIGARDAGSDEGRWYYSIAYRLLRQLRIRVDLQSWWQDKSFLTNHQRLVEFYTEIVLQKVSARIVIFIDEVQCIAHLPFTDQLLSSVRSAHDARATDPEFSRLTFVLLGECDPISLISEPELSPFNITQAVALDDFSRRDLDLFAQELNLSPPDAAAALDRIFYWTGGQPYLCQKLARAVARENIVDAIADNVDRLVYRQLAGRSALHNEPHMSHIHREIVNDAKSEALLTLYGRLRKGINVAADLGSPLQRKLIAIGLLVIDEEGRLRVRNRLYEAVFTARWANENLKINWRSIAIAAGVIFIMIAAPFSYMQLLPSSYVDVLTSDSTELDSAQEAYVDLRSFPGHVAAADNLFRNYIRRQALAATDEEQIEEISTMAATLPDAGRFPDELLADFWNRRLAAATRGEHRDAALIAALESLVLSTPERRRRAAALVADDYPLLRATLPADVGGDLVFDPGGMLFTENRGATMLQWTVGPQGLQRRDDWTITALEVMPLVRRVIVDRDGRVARIGLTLNISHARATDLRIKLIAPSGRAVEVQPGLERASANQDIRVPAAQLRELIDEPLSGTWSLSVRDEVLGVAGHLVGWNLSLNSQGVVEDFQRGLDVPEPVARETDHLWFSKDGRYAIARAMRSDSARIWDLEFAKPVRAVAVNEQEHLIGLSRGAQLLVTATQDAVHLWDISTGGRMATLATGTSVTTPMMTDDGAHLLVQRRRGSDTRFELWSLASASITGTLDIAGTPALVSPDAGGDRLAIADFDRAVRVWELDDGNLVTQVDLEAQPSNISLSAGGDVLGVVAGQGGASLWRLDRAARPMLGVHGDGRWQLAFSPSGSKALVGTPETGFHVYDTADGRLLGPPLGAGGSSQQASPLAFSADEQAVVTGGPGGVTRLWRVPSTPPPDTGTLAQAGRAIWPPSADAVAVPTPDASTLIIGDASGDVYILPANTGSEELAQEENNIGFVGHNSAVRLIEVSRDGSTVASAAADNSVRVWDTASRLPRPFFGSVSGGPIDKLAFSPDATLLGILNGRFAEVMATDSGRVLARFDLGEPHRSLAFADADHLYVGSESGALRAIARNAAGTWALQQIWQGEAAIRWLEASPRAHTLVLVDRNNLVQQFDLAEGRIGEAAVQLPSAVQEVRFTPSGSRVLLRTANWIHRASSSVTGLSWIDAILAPHVPDRTRIVFGTTGADRKASSGGRMYLPVIGNGFVQLTQLNFVGGKGPGLFGSKDQLLDEWRDRLGLNDDES